MSRDDPEYASLDGYVIRRTTEGAVGIAKAQLGLVNGGEHLTWIPRSLCEDGFRLEVGDTDILVETWKAEQEGLDY
ncbi:MAG: hypothetical protein KGR26_16975 [Cyanobacteria bacterium REEB65]|nr:hypothetical protein [Cyanobacteria bacterium REEB65]